MRNMCPERGISKLLFCWFFHVYKLGYKRRLHGRDIYKVPKKRPSSEKIKNKLEKNWNKEVILNSQGNQKTPCLKRAILKTFHKQYSLLGIIMFIQVIIKTSLIPLALAAFMKLFDKSSVEEDVNSGWMLGLLTVLLLVLDIPLTNNTKLECRKIGVKIRTACSFLAYKKMLGLDQRALSQVTKDHITTLLIEDIPKLEEAAMFLHYIWIVPIQSVVAFYLIFRNVGLASLSALVAFLLQAVFLQGYFSKILKEHKYTKNLTTRKRLRLMKDIVDRLQIIKMYVWEKSFEATMKLYRKLEVEEIRKCNNLDGILISCTLLTPKAILYLALISFVTLGYKLTGDVVYFVVQLINTAYLYVCVFLPRGIANYGRAQDVIERLQTFLLIEECSPKGEPSINVRTGEIKLNKVNVSWNQNPIVLTLNNICLNIQPGTLCCIVGDVKSGKSTLLQVISRELPIVSGSVAISGNISYLSEELWLFESDVKNNILLGEQFVEERYKEVIELCDLKRHIQMLPYGDKTLIGNKGVPLTRVQQFKINLARAVYSKADIYLLDNLSTVNVETRIYKKCIIEFLMGKTVVVATNNMELITTSDLIVFVKNGTTKLKTRKNLSENDLRFIRSNSKTCQEVFSDNLHRETLFESLRVLEEPKETDKLIKKATISSIYTEHLKSWPNIVRIIFLMSAFVKSQITCSSYDLWLLYWTNDEQVGGTSGHSNEFIVNTIRVVLDKLRIRYDTRLFYITIFTLLLLGSIFFAVSRSWLFCRFCWKASTASHVKMIFSIVRAPVNFFRVNSTNKILHRLSTDMTNIDELLPRITFEFLQISLIVIGSLVIAFKHLPLMMIPTTILGALCYFFCVVHLRTYRKIKLLEGVGNDSMFDLVSSSMMGIRTIRASNVKYMFVEKFHKLQDRNKDLYINACVSSAAFGFYTDILNVIFISMVIVQFLMYKNDTLPGTVGIVITQCITLSTFIQHGICNIIHFLDNVGSIGRVLQFTKLDREDSLEPVNKPNRIWPKSGRIKFENVYLKYSEDLPAVINNLNIEIFPGEKIGIVGSKCTDTSIIVNSLFRLVPIDGSIMIDDVDISEIELNVLRNNVSIVPQHPIFLPRSIRFNLDPSEKYADEVLWKALECVQLKKIVKHLNQVIDEEGPSFSIEDKQLLCLARALVAKNHILVIDNAFSNTDTHVNIIRKIMHDILKDCTIIAITQNLDIIMDLDKVMVMNDRKVVEFDCPQKLLKNSKGFFAKMIKESNVENY